MKKTRAAFWNSLAEVVLGLILFMMLIGAYQFLYGVAAELFDKRGETLFRIGVVIVAFGFLWWRQWKRQP